MTTSAASLIGEVTFRVAPDNVRDPSTDGRILTRLNWAIREIARIRQPIEFHETEPQPLQQNVATYQKPSDLLITKALKIVELRRDLKVMSLREYGLVDETLTGEPQRFMEFGASYTLYPKPDSAVSGKMLRKSYIRAPVAMGVSDSSPLPVQWDEAIVAGAAYKYLRDNGEFERAAAAQRDYQMLLRIQRPPHAEALVAAGGRSIGLGRRVG